MSKQNQSIHKYRDEIGTTLYEIVRKEDGSVAARRPDPDHPSKFIWNVDDTRKVLYRLDEIHSISASELIFFVTDEKQADILFKHGLFATTHAFGSGHWEESYSRQLNGRSVVIVATRDAQVRDHAERIALSLVTQAQSIRLLELPDGIAAFFNEGNTRDQLLSFAEESNPRSASTTGPKKAGIYESTSAGMYWYKATQSGPIRTPLANFSARITSDIEVDDGAESVRYFGVEATLKGRHIQFSLLGSDFSSMNWVSQNLGAEAVIYPGNSHKEHAKTAIQLLSGSIPKKRRFTHLGWARVEGQWFYLHAGGVIGASSTLVNGTNGTDGPGMCDTPDLGTAEIRLPESLRSYVLPHPVTGDRLRKAIHASLHILETAPHRITVPIFASVYRALLGQADFFLFDVLGNALAHHLAFFPARPYSNSDLCFHFPSMVRTRRPAQRCSVSNSRSA